ncbi:MAG: hypothetical protein ACXW1D_08750, partial [Halobacteriota archaeon]
KCKILAFHEILLLVFRSCNCVEGFKAAQEARPFLYSDKQHNPTFRGLAGAEYGVSIDDGWVNAMHVL